MVTITIYCIYDNPCREIESGSEITTLMVIGTDYIGQYTSSSHTIVDTIVFERAMCSFLSSTRRTSMDLTSHNDYKIYRNRTL
jgi:hypothetical protein